MTIDEGIKNLEYGTKQLEMEIKSGLWIRGSESELCCKEGIALNKQLIEWLTELKELKTTDVQPVKYGHWYDNTYRYIGELDAYFIQACCSCCNRYSDKLDQYTKIMSNETCSHCGANMRGDENG